VSSSTYCLRPADKILVHGAIQPQLLHDYNDKVDHAVVDALVASGTCFEQLATTLNKTTQSLLTAPETAGPQLENLILTLLYLQDYYQVSRKPKL
jgi:hypothetical protein